MQHFPLTPVSYGMLKPLQQLLLGMCLAICLAGCASQQSQQTSGKQYPALWEITSPEQTGKVWLFGTIHALPTDALPRVGNSFRRFSQLRPVFLYPKWVSPDTRRALSQSDRLVLELVAERSSSRARADTQQIANNPAANQQLRELAPLLPNLSGAEREQLLAAGQRRGLSERQLERLTAPSLLFMLSQLPPQDGQFLDNPGVEDWLSTFARRNRLRIVGLEDTGDRLEAITATMLDLETQEHAAVLLNYLQSSISTSPDPIGDLERLYERWRQGDIEVMSNIRERFANRYPNIHNAFIAYRNQAWIPRIKEHIHSGKDVFIAVGEGHLHGPGSLRDLLQSEGYQVKRIN